MDKTLFLVAQTFALFLFAMSSLPWLLKRGHWALSAILPLGGFLIFALLSPNNFDFIQRLWRGLGIGVVCVTWGFVNFYLSKRETKNSES
jgi:hypothetical protein